MKKFKYLLNAHATIGYISVNINTQRANQIYGFCKWPRYIYIGIKCDNVNFCSGSKLNCSQLLLLLLLLLWLLLCILWIHGFLFYIGIKREENRHKAGGAGEGGRGGGGGGGGDQLPNSWANNCFRNTHTHTWYILITVANLFSPPSPPPMSLSFCRPWNS